MRDYEDNLERLVGIMMPMLGENERRVFLAVLAEYLGHGAISRLSEMTGVSRSTINAGRRDASLIPIDPKARSTPKPVRHIPQRAPGGGRKSVVDTNPEILDMLGSLIDGQSGLGQPEPLTWTTRSLRNIQETLQMMGMTVSHTTVASLLAEMGFRYRRHRQGEGETVSVREKEAQFRLINETAKRFLVQGNPVIMLDFRKKERTCADEAEEGECPSAAGSKPAARTGDEAPGWRYVDACISDATAPYVVSAVRSWWETAGRAQFPQADRLYITAEGDAGMELGVWKQSLAGFGRDSGLTLTVSHFPTGTSKWNAVENQLNTYISINSKHEPNHTYSVNISLVTCRAGFGRGRAEHIAAMPMETLSEGLWNYRI